MSKRLPEKALVALLDITVFFAALYPANFTFVIFQNLLFKMRL